MEALSNYDMAVKAACCGRNREAIAFALLALVDEFRKPEPEHYLEANP